MNLGYIALKEYEPDVNVRDYIEADFWRILTRDKVFYEEKPLDVKGYYEVDEFKREYIVVDSKLTGAEKLRTQLHEGCHHLLDFPIADEIIKVYRSMEVIQTRQDMNAEMLSLVMMFSFPTLETYLRTGKIPQYLEPYIQERLAILHFHGF